jgi:hypothetical protein
LSVVAIEQVADTMTHGAIGIVSPYGDEGSLADSIIGLTTDGELRAQKGVGCQSSVLRNRDG